MGIFLSKTVTFSPKEEIRDPEGRYILISGSLNETLYTFISYHVPNRGQASFFSSMLDALSPHFVGTVIMGSDSNVALDQMLDKSGNGHSRLLRPPKQILKIAKTL